MTSIRRFISNTYTDAEKQDAINLFLGNFVPQHDQPALWDLDSDYFLHTGIGQAVFCHSSSGLSNMHGQSLVIRLPSIILFRPTSWLLFQMCLLLPAAPADGQVKAKLVTSTQLQ